MRCTSARTTEEDTSAKRASTPYRYQGTCLFSELAKTVGRLRRFVMFVCRPKALIYGEPKTSGREQDLSPEAAAKRAEIRILKNLYGCIFQPCVPILINGIDRIRRERFNRTAALEQPLPSSKLHIKTRYQKQLQGNRATHPPLQNARSYTSILTFTDASMKQREPFTISWPRSMKSSTILCAQMNLS